MNVRSVKGIPNGTTKRQLRDRLKTEYEYEQRKKLRDLIGCYHGGILQAVEEFNYRMMSLYASEDEDCPNVGDDYQGVGSDPNNYYFQTTVHRFLALFVLIRRFESEALYADSRIADKKDFEFLKYSRAILWAATGTHLFSGLAYDVSESKDHFFRDDLRRACDHSWINGEGGERFISLDELRELMGKEEWLNSTLDFFNGLRADEQNRYRWDRLVALHLILLAFIKDFGHEFQRPHEETIEDVASEFRNLEVSRNLLNWLPKFGLLQETDGEQGRLREWPPWLQRAKHSGIHAVAKALKSTSKQ